MSPGYDFSVGIVGAGSIVRDAHLPVLAASAGLSPIWITDADDARARQVARSYGIRAVPAAEAPLGLPQADIVLLAIPHGAREPYYDALRDRDVALYVEKPVAATVEEHRRIVDAFAPPHRVAHGLQRRSFGPTRLAQQLVDDGPLGALVSIDCGFGRPGGGRYAGFRADVRQAGGGILFEHGIHLLDSVLFLTRAAVASVRSARMAFEAGFDVHTEIDLDLRTSAGRAIPCSFRCSWLCETETGIILRFEHAELAYSIYDSTGKMRLSGRGSRSTYRVLPEWRDPLPLTAAQTLHDHWDHVARALRDRQANYTSACESILTTQIVESCYERGRREAARLPARP